MSRTLLLVATAALIAVTLLLIGGGTSSPVQATHGNLNVHVHDDYYHPVGTFGSPTDHNAAMAACQVLDPAATCDANIHAGDTITWVVPGTPATNNQHTVTECTDNSFGTCGANVDTNNPIDTSGIKTPTQWPYGPITFTAPGTYYYKCEIHPDVMRGRVVVAQAPTASPTPSLTAAPTTAATASPTPTAGPAGVPPTGGDPGDGGLSQWPIALLLSAAVMLAAVAAVTLRTGRRA